MLELNRDVFQNRYELDALDGIQIPRVFVAKQFEDRIAPHYIGANLALDYENLFEGASAKSVRTPMNVNVGLVDSGDPIDAKHTYSGQTVSEQEAGDTPTVSIGFPKEMATPEGSLDTINSNIWLGITVLDRIIQAKPQQKSNFLKVQAGLTAAGVLGTTAVIVHAQNSNGVDPNFDSMIDLGEGSVFTVFALYVSYELREYGARRQLTKFAQRFPILTYH